MKPLMQRAIGAALTLVIVPAAPAAAQGWDWNATSPDAASWQVRAPSSIESRRSVLIDAASATLYMMEDGRIVDSMKVIVGKPTAATPELKTSISYATLNPYWHVPTDIARTLTAPNVLKHGTSYLRERGYEVLSSFGPGGQVLDPETIDWQAVADGRETVFVRQRPGPANSMGRMKFNLDYAESIYLHDTPVKELFNQEDRNLSAGCVRLEDAPRLARWLLGTGAPVAASDPEQHIRLPRQVPVTITYLDPHAQMQLAALR